MGAAGVAGHADERRCAGKGFKATGAAAGAARGIGRIQNDHVARLGCSPGVPGQQLAAQHNTRAYAGAQGYYNRAFGVASAARQRFAQRGDVRVVADYDRQPHFIIKVVGHLKIVPVEIVGVQHHAVIHRAGAADTDGCDLLPCRQLQTQRGNIVTDRLRRAGQICGGGCFFQNLAVRCYQRGLNVRAAEVNP